MARVSDDISPGRLHQEDLPPGTRVRAFGKLNGEVQPWIFEDEPHQPWGVYVMIDGSECLNLIHCGHLEKLTDEQDAFHCPTHGLPFSVLEKRPNGRRICSNGDEWVWRVDRLARIET